MSVMIEYCLLIGVLEVANPAHNVHQVARLGLLCEPATFTFHDLPLRPIASIH